MNNYGSFTAKEDLTHHKGISAEGYQIHNLTTTPVTPTSVNLATPNISNFGYTNVSLVTASSNSIFQLDLPYISGLRKTLHCASLAATSMPAKVYAGSTAFEACFLSVAGNTSNSLATMYQGSVLELLAISTNKWLVTSNCTAGSTTPVSFSSST